ncbi:ubiquitin carboxyl-terminal hydrolase family protein, partial [Trifolium pratense]
MISNKNEDDWGFTSFMTLTGLHDPKEGFIVKNAIIVGAEVFVFKSRNEKQVNQAVNLNASVAFGCQTGYKEGEVPRPKPESTNVETRSPVSKQADAELVSAALGRVIYFLKTRKVKDMNEQA